MVVYLTLLKTIHLLSLDNLRVSCMSTLSPVLYTPVSSCALNLVVTLYCFLYFGCIFRRVTATTTVFVILSETTTPFSIRPLFFCSVSIVSFYLTVGG